MTDLDTTESGRLGLAESGSRLQHRDADQAGGTMKSIAHAAPAVDVKTLHAKIGELTLENDFLSVALGKAGLLPSAKR